MLFEFATAARIIFGAGKLAEIGPLAAQCGQRALVVTGRNSERTAAVLSLLDDAGVATTVFSVEHCSSSWTLAQVVMVTCPSGFPPVLAQT